MRTLQVGDTVRLVHGVPHLLVPAGSLGIVQSIWFAPAATYEVECQIPDEPAGVRVLVSIEQIRADHGSVIQMDEAATAAVTTS